MSGEEAARPAREAAEAAVRTLLAHLGADPAAPELAETPRRVVEALGVALSGYGRDPRAALGTLLPADGMAGQLVELRDVAFSSHCEHHLSPFFGRVDVALVVGERLPGIGHVADVVDVLARRLQIQERLTRQIADVLEDALVPRGLAVVVRAVHTCMALHGPARRESWLRTVELRGVLREDPALVAHLLAGGRP